ncbi:hypothetical protein BDZ89DRAFT_1072706 [Hymenopellis radicata]|nr:hypothetical protein BDZ89DRAFT_1072706 [Hymenopellis radicata]
MDLGVSLLCSNNSPHVTPNDELDVHCRASQYNTAPHPNTRRTEIKIPSPSNGLEMMAAKCCSPQGKKFVKFQLLMLLESDSFRVSLRLGNGESYLFLECHTRSICPEMDSVKPDVAMRSCEMGGVRLRFALRVSACIRLTDSRQIPQSLRMDPSSSS